MGPNVEVELGAEAETWAQYKEWGEVAQETHF